MEGDIGWLVGRLVAFNTLGHAAVPTCIPDTKVQIRGTEIQKKVALFLASISGELT